MKRTPWFKATVFPVRVGWYEWKGASARRYWNGVEWRDSLMGPIPWVSKWRGVQK